MSIFGENQQNNDRNNDESKKFPSYWPSIEVVASSNDSYACTKFVGNIFIIFEMIYMHG
jgi:hypothetical protein